jgi:prophage DNA circulation protein
MMVDYCHSHTGDAAYAARHHLGDAVREATKAFLREKYGRHNLKRTTTIRTAEANDVAVRTTELEHVVPVKYLINLIANDRAATVSTIKSLIESHTHLVLVTKDEHRRLRTSMPLGWTRGCCPFARYHEAKIKLVCTQSGISPCSCKVNVT